MVKYTFTKVPHVGKNFLSWFFQTEKVKQNIFNNKKKKRGKKQLFCCERKKVYTLKLIDSKLTETSDELKQKKVVDYLSRSV